MNFLKAFSIVWNCDYLLFIKYISMSMQYDDQLIDPV